MWKIVDTAKGSHTFPWYKQTMDAERVKADEFPIFN